ncbi:carboxymuconolactone decarboxylase family protein [Ktedonosporobacter rubrisoli]|nr:carboxymuconolactone decarboxylase family protein [Ktedonosporobacter rubrisoli]
MEDEMKNQANDEKPVNAGSGREAIGRPAQPRIPLLDVSALSEEQRAMTGIGASNVLRMLAHNGGLLKAWLEFGSHLMNGGKVPMRTRELLILRIALRSSCEYEWANHVPGALSAGVTSAEITSLAAGASSWSEADAAALSLVDDLCADNCASEKTWKALAATYDESEIIELLMLIGFYRMNAGLLNSLGVPVEPGRPRLGEGMAYEAPKIPQRPSSSFAAGAHAEAKPDGTWQLKFYHPAATQELRLVLALSEGELSGSLTNEAVEITVPVSEGKIQGQQVIFTTVMTKPYPITITWDGTIDGDYLVGTAKLHGAGSFPFDGTRIA